MHPQIAQSWRQNPGLSLHNWTDADFNRAQAVFPKVLELLRRLHKEGVPLLIDSDSYASGDWFWRELILHRQAGLDNWHILRLVTSEAARRLDLPRVGRLKEGYFADLIVLADNPLQDIAAVQSVTRVFQRGRSYEVAQLRSQLETTTKNPLTAQKEQ
jgi:imidazolonepropionase-like amidohydrolase